MLDSTKLTALDAAARIAGLAALTSGLACQPKAKNVLVPPTQPPAAEPPKDAQPVAPAKAESKVQAATPTDGPKEPSPFPEGFDACRTVLNDAQKNDAEQSSDASEKTKTCCKQYTQHLDTIELSRDSGMYGFCCEVLEWRGSAACTPWGPPMPPSFPV